MFKFILKPIYHKIDLVWKHSIALARGFYHLRDRIERLESDIRLLRIDLEKEQDRDITYLPPNKHEK